MNKINFYNVLGLAWEESNVKCKKCGGKTITSLKDKVRLFGCIDDECDMFVFKDEVHNES